MFLTWSGRGEGEGLAGSPSGLISILLKLEKEDFDSPSTKLDVLCNEYLIWLKERFMRSFTLLLVGLVRAREDPPRLLRSRDPSSIRRSKSPGTNNIRSTASVLPPSSSGPTSGPSCCQGPYPVVAHLLVDNVATSWVDESLSRVMLSTLLRVSAYCGKIVS